MHDIACFCAIALLPRIAWSTRTGSLVKPPSSFPCIYYQQSMSTIERPHRKRAPPTAYSPPPRRRPRADEQVAGRTTGGRALVESDDEGPDIFSHNPVMARGLQAQSFRHVDEYDDSSSSGLASEGTKDGRESRRQSGAGVTVPASSPSPVLATRVHRSQTVRHLMDLQRRSTLEPEPGRRRVQQHCNRCGQRREHRHVCPASVLPDGDPWLGCADSRCHPEGRGLVVGDSGDRAGTHEVGNELYEDSGEEVRSDDNDVGDAAEDRGSDSADGDDNDEEDLETAVAAAMYAYGSRVSIDADALVSVPEGDHVDSVATDPVWVELSVEPGVVEQRALGDSVFRGRGSRRVPSLKGSFETMFPLDLMRNIVKYTNRKGAELAANRGAVIKWAPLCLEEFQYFLGVLLMMTACSWRASRSSFWSRGTRGVNTRGPFGTSMSIQHMSCRRFEGILRALCLHDPDNCNHDDPFHKVTEFLAALNCAFLACSRLALQVCIDESMIPFKGRKRGRVFVGGKRHPWGFKVFVLADSTTHYVHCFELYRGRDVADVHASGRGAGYDVVMRLCSKAAFFDASAGARTLYVDRWYSSVPLAAAIAAQGHYFIGSVDHRRRYLPTEFRVTPTEDRPVVIHKLEFWSEGDTGSLALYAVKALDGNGKFRVLSSVRPVLWPDAHLNVQMYYRKFMGGVDRVDQLRAWQACDHLRSVRYFVSIFNYALSLVVNNARIHYQAHAGRVMAPFDFLMECAVELTDSWVRRRTRARARGTATQLDGELVSPRRAETYDTVERRNVGVTPHVSERIKGNRKMCRYCYKVGRGPLRTADTCRGCRINLHNHSMDTGGKTCHALWHEGGDITSQSHARSQEEPQ
jgi:hypothetical protein